MWLLTKHDEHFEYKYSDRTKNKWASELRGRPPIHLRAPGRYNDKQQFGSARYLGYRYDNERAPAGTLGDDCQEFGVDGAEVVVVHVLGDGEAVEAVLPVAHFSVDISKLGASVGRTPWHLREETQKRRN